MTGSLHRRQVYRICNVKDQLPQWPCGLKFDRTKSDHCCFTVVFVHIAIRLCSLSLSLVVSDNILATIVLGVS
jgi:hypothetical protein